MIIKNVTFDHKTHTPIISYEVPSKNVNPASNEGWGNEKHSKVDFPEPALPSFAEAMQALIPFVLEICALPKDYSKDMEVKSVTFSEQQKRFACTISAVKKVNSKSPFNIHTPITSEAPEGAKDGSIYLSDECLEALDKLEAECIKYLKGERAAKQKNLFNQKLAVDEQFDKSKQEEKKAEKNLVAV